ncbi:MAG: phosphate acyltransferase PlsX [Gammaproteobacteria bacterium]
MSICLSIDAMGGDHGPSVTVPAAADALAKSAGLELILVGDEQQLASEVAAAGLDGEARVRIVHAPQVVEMHERPSSALRGKRESSMRRAIDLVKSGDAQACVSAGNTGALMAIARFVLKTLPGIDRPAICGTMPGTGRPTHVLDLGANVDSSSAELFRFAVMGAVLAEAIDERENPSVALLNIGEEEMKGNDRVKQTAVLLESSALNYAGFAEGDDIYASKFDVIVCDGFVGNVALKASEGVARMLTDIAREEFKRSWLTRLGALGALPALKSLRRRADPRRYNGASLLGLRGTVVKSHGGADVLSFEHAIEVAVAEADKNVPERIAHLLEQLLEDPEPET